MYLWRIPKLSFLFVNRKIILKKAGIAINDKVRVESIEDFDNTWTVSIGKKKLLLTSKVSSLIKMSAG